MIGNEQRRESIAEAFRKDGTLHGTSISIEVLGNVAVLGGTVQKYSQKVSACQHARNVPGVKTVSDKITVIPKPEKPVTDDQLLATINKALRKQLGLSSDKLATFVLNGEVSISGNLKWKYQKQLVFDEIAMIDGVTDIKLQVNVPETLQKSISKSEITEAIDSPAVSGLHVEIIGNKVVINGLVTSDEQKDEVTRKIKAVPGVVEVENLLYLTKI